MDGYCLGGGLLVALHAGLLVATERSQFGIPAARLGVGYPIEGVEQLVGRVGDANAALILMTGNRFSAEMASSMGLAHKVVPADDLDQEVDQLCDRIVANAPLTLRAVKLSIAAAAGRGDRQAALDAIADCWASNDFAEGRTAFAEHREPRFQGR